MESSMAKRKNSKRPDREGQKIQNAGFAALVIGFAFLISPMFIGQSKTLKTVSAGLSSDIAWWFIALGAGVLLFHSAINRIVKRIETKATDSVERKSNKVNTESVIKPRTVAKLPSKATFATEPNAQPQTQWSKKVFSDIEWRRFEAVCEKFYSQGKFRTKSQRHGPDGGVDIWMYFDDSEKPVSIVQCKNHASAIGVDKVRSFYGVMAANKLVSGQYVTSSTYTADARKFAEENGINAVDGDKLLQLFLSRTPAQQKELLDVAYEGEYAIPTCAGCGVKMVERLNKQKGTTFWACKNSPPCRNTLNWKSSISY